MLRINYKIFNLSFPKSGTSSFITAMKNFGLRTKHWDKKVCELFIQKKYIEIFNIINDNDVFADFPWPIMYRQLDENFFGKFILIEREEKKWLSSCLNYFDENNSELSGGSFFREHVFGHAFPKGNEIYFLEKYKSHNELVKEYFKNKKNFISINLDDKDGWKNVCVFLGIPQIKFPHLNKNINT
jgi:hypothetical protein